MRPVLTHPERDLDAEAQLPANADDLIQDLELGTIFDAMARGDGYLRDLATHCLLAGPTEPDAIRYRQAALRDCLAQPAVIRELYALSVDALDKRRLTVLFWGGDTPDARLNKSLNRLELLAEALRSLRALADQHHARFRSDAFTRLFAAVQSQLDDDYLDRVDEHRKRLRFENGVLMSAGLGAGSRGTGYVLRKASEPTFFERLTTRKAQSYSFVVPARDEHGIEALSALRDRGVNLVATALGQSTEHLLSFFRALRAELGFYVACLNLHEALVERGQDVCFPEPLSLETREFSARELYDVALAFHLGSNVVGNDVAARGKELVVITGANQGGKSTFLRSVGLAQLMMQAGMFVGARELSANVCTGLFTHYKREEDASMEKGKLDEELARMSAIADLIAPGSLLLCNESFASTNEREGSEIGRQVVSAFLGSGVKVFFVTHLYDLAESLHGLFPENALFLRAQRGKGGRRPFRLDEGAPLPTSFGEDSFKRVFGRSPKAVATSESFS